MGSRIIGIKKKVTVLVLKVTHVKNLIHGQKEVEIFRDTDKMLISKRNGQV